MNTTIIKQSSLWTARIASIAIFASLLAAAGLLAPSDAAQAQDQPSGQGGAPSPEYSPIQVAVPLDPLLASAGGSLYQENCAPCHGAEGLGDGPKASELPDVPTAFADATVTSSLTPAEMFFTTKYGRTQNMMPPWEQRLDDSQIWNAVAYAWSLHTQQRAVEAGKDLYAANCASCHGATGMGDGPEAEGALPDFSDLQYAIFKSQADWQEGWQAEHPQIGQDWAAEDRMNVLEYIRTFSVILPWQPAYKPGSGIITGVLVQSASAAASVAGAPVVLVASIGSDQIASFTSTVSAAGVYTFENLATDPSIAYVTAVDYEGAKYVADSLSLTPLMPTGQNTVTVYGATDDPGNIYVSRAHWIIDYQPGALLAGEIYTFGNSGDRTFVGRKVEGMAEPGTLELHVPEGATEISLDDGALGDRFQQVGSTIYDTLPVIPGTDTRQIVLRYAVPYNGTSLDLMQDFVYPVDQLSLLIADAPGLKAEVSAMEPAGIQELTGQNFQIWRGSDSEPQTIEVAIQNLPQTSDIAPVFAGEVAYVLDGDIWLQDLATGDARRLTTDGDNLGPAWSPDGKYLVYSHGGDLESADVYLLDVDGGSAQLLVEHACCAGWSPDGTRIAYLDVGSENLALMAIAPDGSDQVTLFTPIDVGRGAYPAGSIDWPSNRGLYLPLEVIGTESLDAYRDVFTLNTELFLLDEGMHQADCSILNRSAVADPQAADDSLLVEATAYEQIGGACSPMIQPAVTPKGVSVARFDGAEGRELPWLAAPSLARDGVFLAAERYEEAEDPTDAALWGVVAVNVLTGAQQDVAAGASQPAWRPGGTLDSAALAYVRPGERLITLDPVLIDGGNRYRVSYTTAGDLQRRDAGFLHAASPDFLTGEEVTGIIVTGDGQVVTDAETLQRILPLYHAAYHLYDAPLSNPLPELETQLDSILASPVLPELKQEALAATRSQDAAALRAMFTAPLGDLPVMQLVDAAIAGADGSPQAAVDALVALAAKQHPESDMLAALSSNLQEVYRTGTVTAGGEDPELRFLRFLSAWILLRETQRTRASWLQTYVDSISGRDGSLNRDQLRAAATVLEEQSAAQQHLVPMAEDLARSDKLHTLLTGGGEITQEAAADLLAQVAQNDNWDPLSKQALAQLLAGMSGQMLTATSILYGADDPLPGFLLARRGEELRKVFQAGAAAAVEQRGIETSKSNEYDGGAAASYRDAVLLDTLAGAVAYQAYADGLSKSQHMPELTTLVDELRQQGWEAAYDDLLAAAGDAADSTLGDLANQAGIEAVVALALERVRP